MIACISDQFLCNLKKNLTYVLTVKHYKKPFSIKFMRFNVNEYLYVLKGVNFSLKSHIGVVRLYKTHT